MRSCTANLLPRYPHLQDAKPVYRDFRAGGVRHCLADISQATTAPGLRANAAHRAGLALAMPWYIRQK